MEKNRPVQTFARPVKTSVVDKEIDRVSVKARRRGSRVPKSPNAPDISESGDLRNVRQL